jgi:hypothetical protein
MVVAAPQPPPPPPPPPPLSTFETAEKQRELEMLLSDPLAVVDTWRLRELALSPGGLLNGKTVPRDKLKEKMIVVRLSRFLSLLFFLFAL